MNGPRECRERMLSQSFLHMILSLPIWILGRAQPLKLIASWGAEFVPAAPGLHADPGPGPE